MSKVAVIPLAKFTTEADHKLVADLATSVERSAVVKYLKAEQAKCERMAQKWWTLDYLINDIKRGEHV